MAVNKVVLHDSETGKDDIVMDLTNDTVTSDKLLKGITAHDKQGYTVIGTIPNAEEGVF